MTANTSRRLKTAFALMAVCIPVSLLFELVSDGRVSFAGVIIGVVLAAPLALLEESAFDERVRRLPFSVAIVAKVFTYLGSVLSVFLLVSFVFGWLAGLTLEDFWVSLKEPVFAYQVGLGFFLYVVIVFFRQLDRLLGPGVLLRYLGGRYHRPRRELRIFMFLDLKSSTTLAEELGHERYYGLVNEFFRDISGPVLDNGGEIYEYVGDEAVLTWKEEKGLKDARCLRVFFEIERIIEGKQQRYLDQFGVVPGFKAGVHLGEVISAEIGDLKRGLVFNGDVLNTGARIQAECGRLGKRLVSSAELFNRLVVPEGWGTEALGPVKLRGKSEPTELVAIG
ncbi:MAG: adenylate/guanylate cyclase domain-containing protein [Gemmatimonadota bacterium]